MYLSSPCDDGNLGKEYIRAAMRTLFSHPSLDNSEGISTNSEGAEAYRPTLLWNVMYVQEAAKVN